MYADKIIKFLLELEYHGNLPDGISIMNPYRENPEIPSIIQDFYRKFYNDTNERYLILGINPGRNGAGVTGIPFTDTKRLTEKCGISIPGLKTFEPSSVFIYDMIQAYGGPTLFYSKFFISAACPLGFTSGNNGRQINYNYYDSRELLNMVRSFMIENLRKQLAFGFNRDKCFCLGTGKNYKFLMELNEEFNFFKEIIPLEHPRYVMQYKSKTKDAYIARYLDEFGKL